MFTITKEFGFEAAHYLRGLPDGHQCARLHGHSYRVQVVLEAQTLDDRGFVRDYGDLSLVKAFLDSVFDHRCINEVAEKFRELRQPTAENIARFLFMQFGECWPELTAVRVSETGQTWAEYRPGK